MANTIRILATLDDKVSTGLDRIRDKFDTLGKSKGFQSIVSGVGLGIGIAAWQMAASRIGDVIGSAIEAAKEEEVSIQKLGSALRANIADWNGRTDAIERVLQAQMRLGFSDDEQRDSLAGLVAATHDVNEALDIQRTAMDLARFKGISLADASEALTKVEAGSYRILKSLGIQLKDGATQTEALAAVQKVAAGQAEDYAKTNTGKLLVSQVKVNEAMEKFGLAIMPAVANAASASADAITGLAAGFDILQGNIPQTNDAIAQSQTALLHLYEALALINPLAETTARDLRDALERSSSTTEDNAGKMEDDLRSVRDALDATGGASTDMASDMKSSTFAGAHYMDLFRGNIISDAKDAATQGFDILGAHARLMADNAKAASDRAILASSKSTAAQKADARSTLIDTAKDQADQLLILADAGQTGSKIFQQGLKDLEAVADKQTGLVGRDLQMVIDKLKEIERIGAVVPINFKFTETGAKGHAPGTGPLQFAEGGRVPGPLGMAVPAIVHGGEYVLPAGSGTGNGALYATTNVYLDGQLLTATTERTQYYRKKTSPR